MHVFVYGTLTNAARAEAVLGETARGAGTTDPIEYEFVGEATLEGLHRVEGAYPTLVPGGSVDGRILEVDERGLEALDAYEGLDQGLYVRAGIPKIDELESAASKDVVPVEDHEVSSNVESGTGDAQETDTKNIIWTYIGDPDRLEVGEEHEDGQYWPENEPFRKRVRRHLAENTVGVYSTE